MAVTFRPPGFRFSIPQGQTFHREFVSPAVDPDTREPYDFVAGGCTARMDVVKQDGTVVVSFATSGEDGVIELGHQGEVSLHLAAAYTDALIPTTEYAGALHAPVYGDLVITDPGGIPWLMAKGSGDITRKVTSS